MALDAKAIKEEIPDKDVYETTTRRSKGNCLQSTKFNRLFKFAQWNDSRVKC